MSFPNKHPTHRNSTIKQEQQPQQNNLQNDSSISLHEGTDVHYYNLDYSDERGNNDIVSSSDQEEREITHEEFMHMISTNMERHSKSSEEENYQQKYQENQEDQDQEYDEMQYRHRRHHYQIKSNDFKQLMNKKKFTPSTRDKSHNFHQYGHKNKLIQRNDPQKSNSNQNHPKKSRETSFNAQTSVNSVKEFRIDSFLNAHAASQKYQQKSKAWKQYREIKSKPKKIEDSQFSLITLPEYDEESSSFASIKKAENQHQQQRKKFSKYKHVAHLQEPEENAYDKLNWRYQEAKLKFMDNFLPDSMKIGNNSYNMLKYMTRKNDLTFNLLKVL